MPKSILWTWIVNERQHATQYDCNVKVNWWLIGWKVWCCERGRQLTRNIFFLLYSFLFWWLIGWKEWCRERGRRLTRNIFFLLLLFSFLFWWLIEWMVCSKNMIGFDLTRHINLLLFALVLFWWLHKTRDHVYNVTCYVMSYVML
jgi:hypothetical protein